MMKKYMLAAMCCLPLGLMAQSGYIIDGKLSTLKEPAKAYLSIFENNEWKLTDSVKLKNGVFRFQGTLASPNQAYIRVKRINTPERRYYGDQLSFVIENAKIKITGTDSITNASLTGSVGDREQRELRAQISPLTDVIIKLNDEFGKKREDGDPKKPTEEARKKAGETVMKNVAEIAAINLRFVESHPNSYMGMYTFYYSVLDSHFDPAKAEPLFNRFSPALKASDLGKKSIERINAAKRRQAGVKATDFTQNDINGKPFTLSSLRGKYVLVDFWASWCAPCRAENPNLLKAYEALKSKNLEIISISVDNVRAAWENAVKVDNLPWIQLSDLKGMKNEVAVLYDVNAVPQNILINPQGLIIGKNLRGEDLTEKLDALIK